MSFAFDKNQNVFLTRGDRAEFTLDLKWRVTAGGKTTIRPYEPTAQDIIRYTVRRAPKGQDSSAPLIQKTIGPDLLVTLLPSETDINYGVYWHDAEVMLGGDPERVYTAFCKRFKVLEETT